MHIISGKYKGKLIKAPRGIRPTEDRVRKAFFDIIEVSDLSFLELFAGSGAMGLEALSMGAKEAVFVEKDNLCVESIRNNIEYLGIKDANTTVMSVDALGLIPKLAQKGQRFDIIFLDPPYYKGLSEKTLQILGAYDILTPLGFVVVQHFKKDILPEASGRLLVFKQAKYGDTVLSFYEQKSHISRQL